MNPTTDISPISYDPAMLVSISGIVALTWAIVNLVIASFGNITFLKNVPIMVYAVVVSGVLCFLANRVLHSLPGDLASLMTYTILSALGSGGAATWLKGKALNGPEDLK